MGWFCKVSISTKAIELRMHPILTFTALASYRLGRHLNISLSVALYIYSTNIGTKYFKYGIYSPFFPLQNAVCFIILTYLVPVLFTFYIQGLLKLKKNPGAKRLMLVSLVWTTKWRKQRNLNITANSLSGIESSSSRCSCHVTCTLLFLIYTGINAGGITVTCQINLFTNFFFTFCWPAS